MLPRREIALRYCDMSRPDRNSDLWLDAWDAICIKATLACYEGVAPRHADTIHCLFTPGPSFCAPDAVHLAPTAVCSVTEAAKVLRNLSEELQRNPAAFRLLVPARPGPAKLRSQLISPANFAADNGFDIRVARNPADPYVMFALDPVGEDPALTASTRIAHILKVLADVFAQAGKQEAGVGPDLKQLTSSEDSTKVVDLSGRGMDTLLRWARLHLDKS